MPKQNVMYHVSTTCIQQTIHRLSLKEAAQNLLVIRPKWDHGN